MQIKQTSKWWFLSPNNDNRTNICCTIEINNCTYVIMPVNYEIVDKYNTVAQQGGDNRMLLIPIENIKACYIRNRTCTTKVIKKQQLQNLEVLMNDIVKFLATYTMPKDRKFIQISV